MSNVLTVNSVINDGRRLTYKFTASGDWTCVFNLNEEFFIEYGIDISSVPYSIAIIPFLANVLPIAWVCDGEINIDCCDFDFYKSIPDFKKGYEDMYPMINFGGKVSVKSLEKNSLKKDGGAMAFFSGGVDAFNTLVTHASEHPALITLWGADIKLEDAEGWKNVEVHLKSTAEQFDVDFVTVRSSFRKFLKEGRLSKLVEASGDGWWHGFQHGIGIICHAAPAAVVMGKSVIYFASSFTAADRGKVTCASDPTIDNYVTFSGVQVFHDGYEFNRQAKIHNIIKFEEKSGMTISLRVCWRSAGGNNCCRCEKCWRTVLGIYAEGKDPRKFGFHYSDDDLKKWSNKMKWTDDKMLSKLRYGPIQDAMRKNNNIEALPKELHWFYKKNKEKLGKHPFVSFFKKLKNKIISIVYRGLKYVKK